MSWTNLKTTYKDATWSGSKVYEVVSVDENAHTYNITDKTSYTNLQDSFFGAADANAINTAINNIMNGSGPLATGSQAGICKPDGTTITVTAGSLTVPTATKSKAGIVRPDGSTITINNGVISAAIGSNLSTASTSTAGVVKVDGSSIVIASGVISVPYASTSKKGIASFNSTYFSVSNGVVTINSTGINALIKTYIDNLSGDSTSY